MSVIKPNETSAGWRSSKRETAIQLYLSSVDAAEVDLVGSKVAGLPVALEIISSTDWIDPDELAKAAVALIQVDPDNVASLKRFQKLAQTVSTPLIAGAYEPPLAFVRSLVRSGAQDVIPLPVSVAELEASLAGLGDQLAHHGSAHATTGKLVTFIKAVGGVGATAVMTQLAIRFAQNEARRDRHACLIDLDLQFGDAALQLGLNPKFSSMDLLGAGARLDGDLLRATCSEHPSGLKVIAAPVEMIPIEGIPIDHLLRIIELARREFDTVFVDLPSNWTNWSLSVVAQSDLVFLVTELSVPALSRAKRQLALLDSQDLSNVQIRMLVNRFEKALARTMRATDVREVLGRDLDYRIANDFPLMRSAIDRGIPINEVKRKSALANDLDTLDGALAAALGLER